MKRHFITIFKVLLIIAAALGLIYAVLRIDKVDRALTKRFNGSENASQKALVVEDFDKMLPGDKIPYVFSYDDRLFVINGKILDITPPGIQPVFYSSGSGISEKLMKRSHCAVSDDKRFMLYTVEVQGISRLFLADLEQGGAVLVSDNVDEFLFVGEYPVYSTGYEVSSSVYYYCDGESVLLGCDVRAVPDVETLEVSMIDADRNVTVCNLTDGTTYVEEYSDAFDDNSNAGFTSDGREILTVLWSRKGSDISVIALKDGIYTLRFETKNAAKIASFSGKMKLYKNKPELIRNNLNVWSSDGKTFYISYLNSDSFILNPDYSGSWLNKMSNYEYSVAVTDLEGNVSFPSVPSSGLPVYFEKAGDKVVYTAYLGSGDVKSISVLSGSTVLLRDAVLSEKLSKGQKSINADVFEDGTVYILTTDHGADYTAINRVLPDASGIETVYGCISLGVFYDEDFIFEEEYDPESGV